MQIFFEKLDNTNTSSVDNNKECKIQPHIQAEHYKVLLIKVWFLKKSCYCSASEAFDATYPTNVVVTSEGVCTYIPPGIFMSSCPIDITWFPFDDQNCDMKFGSWTYNGFKVWSSKI